MYLRRMHALKDALDRVRLRYDREESLAYKKPSPKMPATEIFAFRFSLTFHSRGIGLFQISMVIRAQTIEHLQEGTDPVRGNVDSRRRVVDICKFRRWAAATRNTGVGVPNVSAVALVFGLIRGQG